MKIELKANQRPQPGIWLLAVGAIGLGVAGLALHNFPLQDRQVPGDVPLRSMIAIAGSVALVVAGATILLPPTRRIGAWLLALLYALWIVAVQLPGTLGMPRVIGMWLGPAELMTLIIACLLLIRPPKEQAVETGARVLFGLCLIIFGVCHFAYDEITASMVPAWFPEPYFWAYATGIGHLLAGAAIMTGTLARLAATLWAAMCTSFVLLLHLPRVAAHPAVHTEWTMLFTALSIAASGWILCSRLSYSLPPWMQFATKTRPPNPAL